MEDLPVDIMTRVLEFSFVAERLILAQCSTGLLNLITEECSNLWETIDFWKGTNTQRKWNPFRMTDSMLQVFLTRVNARQVTKFLSIALCGQIQGSGLEPLRGSRVLERADLRTGGTRFDEALVMDILRTMLPHKLYEVHLVPFRQIPKVYSNESLHTARRESFHRDLRAARYQQALESRTACASCSHPVCVESKQIVPNVIGMPSTRCSSCNEQYCRGSSCPVTMLDCCTCDKASCEACNKVKKCDKCLHSYCGDCKYIPDYPCLECDGIFCISCDYGQHCAKPGCKNALCSNCADQHHGDISFFRCDDCDEFYCHDCVRSEVCDSCEMSFCAEHCESKYCGCCGKSFSVCSQCWRETCDHCRISECGDCQGSGFIRRCYSCGASSCGECGEVATCHSCGSSNCRECSTPGECPLCNMQEMSRKRQRLV